MQCCAHGHYLQPCGDCGTDFTEQNQQILNDELADRLVCGDADAPDGDNSVMWNAHADTSVSAVEADLSEAVNSLRGQIEEFDASLGGLK